MAASTTRTARARNGAIQDFFFGDHRPGHTVLLVYLNGSTPVSIQLVFTAPVITSPKPYGLGFSLNVPIIKVLPEASDASAKSSF